MAFNIERFGSNSSNIKSILGGVNRYYYYNKDGNTLTTAGYFPNNLGLAVGDRIQVVPKVKTDPEETYVVSSITDRVVTVTQIDTDGAVDSVNGKTGHVVLDASDVHALPDSTVIPAAVQYETMPTADASNAGKIVEYVGVTDSTYTNGYFYKNQPTPVYTGTVSFNPASISGVTTTCNGDSFATFVGTWGSGNITDIIKGTLTYDQSGGLLVFVGLDDTNTQVCTFQLYTQDYEDAGFVFSGTLSDGDVINFTCTINESAVYAWNRIDVQPTPVIPSPLPSQTGNAGKFLTTDGTDASWGTINALQNTATGTNSLTLLGNATIQPRCIGIGNSSYNSSDNSIAVGYMASIKNLSGGSVAIGDSAEIDFAQNAIAIGKDAKVKGQLGASAHYAVQIGPGTNTEAFTIQYTVYNNGYITYKLLNADGTIPADRLASTTGLADGNYRLRLTMASGVPTLTWVAE